MMRPFSSLLERKVGRIVCSRQNFHQGRSRSAWVEKVGPQSSTTKIIVRSLSSPKGPAPKLRFYDRVEVIEVDAPWEKNGVSDATVDSPVSAGVDGTKSASGVVGHVAQDGKEGQLVRDLLTPRPFSWSKGTTDEEGNDNNDLQWYGVTLDGRTLRSPVGNILAVPSLFLAHSIAAEWNAVERQIQPVQMPLMTLSCTTLDQVSINPSFYRETALRFLPTDNTCYWADPLEDRVLNRRQESAWRGLHEFIEKEFEHAPTNAMGTQEGMLLSRRQTDGKKVRGLPHPAALVDACTEWIHGLDAWHLTAFNSVASESKSFFLSYAILHPTDGPFAEINEKTLHAARVEEEFQIENWGLVEGGHDYDRINCAIQVRSAHLLTSFLHQKV